ncbi:MAG: hypothetical protein OIF32_11830 [Campylobacterales bacterium]|nr:hypothetical protein [Campylobacterales bacterium]
MNLVDLTEIGLTNFEKHIVSMGQKTKTWFLIEVLFFSVLFGLFSKLTGFDQISVDTAILIYCGYVAIIENLFYKKTLDKYNIRSSGEPEGGFVRRVETNERKSKKNK